MLNSSTKTGRFVNQNIEGNSVYTAIDDGSASYLVLGTQARKMILNKYIEGVIKADYAFRTGGTTMYGKYSEQTGKLYNPYGGINVGIGANAIILDQVILGASVERNLESNETIVRLNFGARF